MGEVLVVGAGPVGLTLAIDLARHGVRCRIIDKAAEPLRFCRAIGVTPRTLEVWERMGVVGEMIGAGLWLTGMRSIINGAAAGDEATPDFGLPYGALGLPQYETERLLTAELSRRGIAIERGLELVEAAQDADGVTVQLRSASGAVEEARFAYVVGCDGAHSIVRKKIGAEFEGDGYPWPFMLGDVHIDWDTPYGVAVRALRLHDDAPPDMFIAIPLPEPGRYRVSMLAPPEIAGSGMGHGIQAELPGPSLDDLQKVADDLIPGKPRLSDLRWSSVFRISMRLASRYRDGRLLIAGDAAHIHPPTGGQGMNTGIQDAHNLAWKLAMLVQGAAGETLLASYEAERRPVGAEVVARTRAASEGYGREQNKVDARLVDSQVLVAYPSSPIVKEGAPDLGGVKAGERAPDIRDLSRQGFGYPLRLFDVLDGTRHHVLLARIDAGDEAGLADLARLAAELAAAGVPIRVVAIVPEARAQQARVAVLADAAGAFAAAYGEAPAFLVRPDGYVGWRGRSFRDAGLADYVEVLTGQRG